MKLTKEKLLANDGELALKLAESADKEFANSTFAQDMDILRKRSFLGSNGSGVACWLAFYLGKTGWITDKEEILSLGGGFVRIQLDKHLNKPRV